jgi:uncharacterized protein YhdP
VFREVELAESGAAGVLLRAPTLIVDFDTWRMLRGGALAATRITLENPAIDLAAAVAVRSGPSPSGSAPGDPALTAGARLLSNWRGTRVDIEGGTLKLAAAGGAGPPLELAIRRAALRRSGSRVTADATMLLPQRLGAAAHARLDIVTEPNAAGIPSAALALDAERVDFAGWRAVLASFAPAGALPIEGSGNLTLQVRVERGRVVSAGGTLAATGLAWRVGVAAPAALQLERLRGAWQLARAASGWHLTADRLELRTPAIAIDGVHLGAHLTLEQRADGWRLSSPDLRLDAGALALAVAGTVSGARGAHPWIDARAHLTGADVAPLQRLLGTAPFAALGAARGELAAGRIDDADLELHGPLDEPLPWKTAGARFDGSLELHAASLVDPQLWPDIHDLDAQVAWRGADVRAHIASAEAGTFRLRSGAIEWNARTVHFSGRVAGEAQEALAWLRGHPQLQQYARRLENLDMRGDTLIDFDIRMPAPTARAADAHAVHSRFAAVLDGVRLRPVEGLPPIGALRGTLAVSDGHLQRSTLTGTWLGGPVAFAVSERRTAAAGMLTVSGHGLLNVSQALRAAHGAAAELPALSGTAEWSADFRQLPAARGAPQRWRARLDSSLVGVASRLPEPLAKAAATSLPLHVELAGTDAAGELRLALGERLHAAAALRRQGELWQVERGALSLGAGTPQMPSVPVMRLSGRLSRLDLPACVALWRGFAHQHGWPALQAQLTAAELVAFGSMIREVSLTADSEEGADTLRLDSQDLSGEARWPVAAAPAQLTIEDLKWRGRSLGRLTALLTVQGDSAFDAAAIHLSGAVDDGQGALHCEAAGCALRFTFASDDAAAALASFGLRSDVTASHASLGGELGWQPEGPRPALATATGRLHIELTDGATRTAAAAEAAPDDAPFALLVVPALIAGTGSPELRFASLAADFTLRDGQAVTSDLHFDGEAEILMRGRVGLLTRDYDGQLWIVRGEERLPAALRSLEPAPRIAALWLSLRELLGGQAADRARGALHLRGSWSEPVVTVGE